MWLILDNSPGKRLFPALITEPETRKFSSVIFCSLKLTAPCWISPTGLVSGFD